MAEPLWLTLEGASNVRDIGGLPAAGGRTTRPGVLIRSDAVYQLTSTDVKLLTAEFGVRHIIDLRARGERREQGRGLLESAGVAYSEIDVLTDAMIESRRQEREAAFARGDLEPAAIIADGYQQMLEYGSAAFVTALSRLVHDDGLPALVHCSAGKDRTGVLVALLLDTAGVEREAIIADYAATADRMEHVRARLAAMPAYAQLALQTPAMLLGAHAATMEQFLEHLHAVHGGAANWFVSAGARPVDVEAWRALILG